MVIILSTTFVKASYLEHCADHALVPSVIYIYIYIYIYICIYISGGRSFLDVSLRVGFIAHLSESDPN